MSYIDIKQVGLQNESNQQINPVQDETIILLRKLLQMSQSLTVVDSSQRQRVVVETNANMNQVGNINTFASIDLRFQFSDAARNAFANSIRPNLIFS